MSVVIAVNIYLLLNVSTLLLLIIFVSVPTLMMLLSIAVRFKIDILCIMCITL